MKKYLVMSPEFSTTAEWIAGYPRYETVRDVVEVVARNKRDAVMLGVKYMLEHWRDFEYARDNRSSDLPPWAGIRAYSREDLRAGRDMN